MADVIGRCLSCGDRVTTDLHHYKMELQNLDPYRDEHTLVYFCYKCGTQMINVVMESSPRPKAYSHEELPLQVQFAIEVNYNQRDHRRRARESYGSTF